MFKRIHEFFEDETKLLSMGRLNSFQAMLVGGVILLVVAVLGKLTAGMYGAYLSAGVGHGIVSKVSDSFSGNSTPDITEDATDGDPS